MSEHLLVTQEMLISSLFFIIIIVSLLLQHAKFPYTIGLVIAGIAVALFVDRVMSVSLLGLDDLRLPPHVILYVLLPSLIFEASINIDSRMLMKNLNQVMALAFPGLAISMLIIAAGLTLLTPISLGTGLLFGALISATDPVAVIHTFKQIGAPKRLMMLVDGESLFNDATAIVAFNVVLAMFFAGGFSFSLLAISLSIGNLFYVFFGGILVGFLFAFVMVKLMKKAERDPMVQIAAMTVVAYVAFAVANYYLQVSGVMSVLSAGLVISWYSETYLSREIRLYVKQFWAYIAFIANSLIFLVLGISTINYWVSKPHTPHLPYYTLLGIILVVMARAAIIYGLVPIVGLIWKESKVGIRYKHIIFWGGLRGAVPLALAFSINPSFPESQLVVELTLAIVLFTLLFQGTTLRKLIHFLQLDRKSATEQSNEIETQITLKRRGMQRIVSLECERCLSEAFVEEIKQKYAAEIEQLKKTLAYIHSGPEFPKERIKKLLWHYTTAAEKETYTQLYEQNLISKPVLSELSLNIELTQDRLKRGEGLELFVIYVPMETRAKAYLARLLSRFIVQNKYVSRLIQQAFLTKYEISLAMVIACNHIEPIIDKLANVYDIEIDIAKECLAFYRERRKLALDYMAAVDEEDVPQAFRKEKMNLVAVNAEYDALNELSLGGKVFDKVFHELKESLEKQLDKAKIREEAAAFQYVK